MLGRGRFRLPPVAQLARLVVVPAFPDRPFPPRYGWTPAEGLIGNAVGRLALISHRVLSGAPACSRLCVPEHPKPVTDRRSAPSLIQACGEKCGLGWAGLGGDGFPVSLSEGWRRNDGLLWRKLQESLGPSRGLVREVIIRPVHRIGSGIAWMAA